MAYTTPGTRQNEIVRLQSEITNEIQRDAPEIAQGVFGDNKNHPDMAQVSNAQLDDLYRSKYMANDRQWLQAEARRDPQQFLDVAKRIGVQPPSTAPGVAPPPPPGAGMQAFAANASAALAPAPPPAPAPTPVLPPPAALPVAPVAPPPVPVILGPNGLPLPPSGP
ncbi:MAG TPA: hypothetical protein VNG35_12200 [Gemmatimonadales bacterium]|nr:hypothetical protein [Gemmatimonadales bacterium]